MQRVFGSLAIFAGWLSLGVGAMTGMAASQFFGLNHVEGDLPPMDVYGLSGAVVLWCFIGAALLTAVPMAMSMVAPDPRRNLRIVAGAMIVTGIVLLPDGLGRAFGLPLLVGAACVVAGGELIHRDAVVAGTAAGLGSPAAMQLGTSQTAEIHDPNPPAVFIAAAPIEAAAPPVPAATVSVASAPEAPAAVEKRGRRASRKQPAVPERLCPWCSTAVPVDAETCPNCHASLDGSSAEGVSIPGLTEVAPALRDYERKALKGKKTSLISMIFSDPPIPDASPSLPPSDAAALRPPSAELKAEMARLDAEIAAGLVPTGKSDEDEASPADPGAAAPLVPGPEEPPGTGATPSKSRRPPRRRAPRA